ncbi:MAG: hypothetical protein QOJ09_2071 [Actinomycetota bacterium]|jgi:hypothetical protein|nr:hypothetical protein [Actinomycetota bacterium]
MTEMKAGSRWRSAVSTTEVIVVKAPTGDVQLECGGHPMVPLDEDPPVGLDVDPAFADTTKMGKRFADPESGIEVLATKGGDGTLAVNGVAIPLKDAKPLPSSD